MSDEQNRLIKELDKILDIEKKALLSGDLRTLKDIVDDKESLIEQLNNLQFEDLASISGIGDKVKHNQILLEKALEGIRSVAKKLAEIRRTRKEFDAYNELGKKNRIEGEPESSVEKRA